MLNLFAESTPPRTRGRPRDDQGQQLMLAVARLAERRLGLQTIDQL
jgi:hypothetical protein